MTDDAQRLAELEAKVALDPESRALRAEVLSFYCDPALVAEPRRIEHIVWYVQNYPRELLARCPFVHVDKDKSPEGFSAIERQWRVHVDAFPKDPYVVLGLASFLVNSDAAQSVQLLRDFLQVDATVAEVWLDLGRYCTDPALRLQYFQQARSLGSDQPNLTAWIASAAIAANDMTVAQAAAEELLTKARELRDRYSENLDCSDSGSQFWKRARQLTANHAEARAFVKAHSSYANHTHWAHTTLGIIAVRASDVEGAVEHLRRSGRVSPEPRLSSYGPSFVLAKELCEAGQWTAVAAYLQDCEKFWKVDRLREMRNDVDQERIPQAWTGSE